MRTNVSQASAVQCSAYDGVAGVIKMRTTCVPNVMRVVDGWHTTHYFPLLAWQAERVTRIKNLKSSQFSRFIRSPNCNDDCMAGEKRVEFRFLGLFHYLVLYSMYVPV